MKIIGAGFGRTGTKSLQLALEQLGYNKCYHMEELLRDPSRVKYWSQAYKEENVEWDKLFEGYTAAVDFPVSMYYKQLADYYPDSKVILTIRDPEKWYESVKRTIYAFDPGPKVKLKLISKLPFSSKARNLFQVLRLNDKSIWDKFFQGKFKDKQYAIDKFNSHIKEVKENIPENRLLIFESKDGWGPLCEFLGKELPSDPYPSTNKRQDFHEWATGVAMDSLSS